MNSITLQSGSIHRYKKVTEKTEKNFKLARIAFQKNYKAICNELKSGKISKCDLKERCEKNMNDLRACNVFFAKYDMTFDFEHRFRDNFNKIKLITCRDDFKSLKDNSKIPADLVSRLFPEPDKKN